jgi:8-hydroxy-5-deazaflavin:NADPH oxidoreductase
MRIAIIGSGNVGSALAKASVKAGHDVVITAAHPENAERVAAEAGAQAAASNAEAVQGADIVVLAVYRPSVQSVLDEVGEDLRGTVVVDPTNQPNEDFTGLADDSTSVAEGLQRQLPDARVVKALNTVFAPRMADPQADGMQLDGYYAGDDESAKARVAELIESIGLRPLDVGGLRSARSLEHLGLLNMVLNARNGWPWQSGWKLLGPTG